MLATVCPLFPVPPRLTALERQRLAVLAGLDVANADTFEDDLSLVDRLLLARDLAHATP